MKKWICSISIILFGTFWITGSDGAENQPAISEATQACLSCHGFFHPGIKSDWERSHHAKVTPAEALMKEKLEKRISNEKVPDALSKTVVGCAECHTLNPEKHQDTFEHNGYKVHVIVTPADCSTCHLVEVEQYGKSLMAYAYVNLNNNTFYTDLMKSVNGVQSFENRKMVLKPPDLETNADSCF
jgi:hydroxylamine dehydrogenase